MLKQLSSLALWAGLSTAVVITGCVSSEDDPTPASATGGMTGASGSAGSAGSPPASGSKAVQVSISNHTWGGGLGIWFKCLDATPFGGIRFWAKGSIPGGMVAVQLTTTKTVEQPVGECAETCTPPEVMFPVTDSWQQHDLAWSAFKAGTSGTLSVAADGDRLYGINFNIPNNNMPNTLTFAIDDVAFLQGSGTSSSAGPNPAVATGTEMPECTSVTNIGTGTAINNFDGMAAPTDSFGFGTPQIYGGFYHYTDPMSTPASTSTLSLEPGH